MPKDTEPKNKQSSSPYAKSSSEPRISVKLEIDEDD